MRKKIAKALESYWFVVAVLFVALIMLATLGKSRADAISTNGEDWVRLTNAPCRIAPVLARAPQGLRGYLREGYAKLGGVSYPMCWFFSGHTEVRFMYEDGDDGSLPIDIFKTSPTTPTT